MGGWYSDEKLEEILLSYPVLKAQATVEAEELRYLFPSCTASYDSMPRGSEVTDGTSTFVVRREEWSRNMRRARAIEIGCAALTAQERDLVRLMYFERWGRYQIRLSLAVQRSQLFNIRRRALDKLAAVLLG